MKKTVFTYCWLLLFAWQASSQLPDYHVQMMIKKTGLMQPDQAEEIMKDNKGFLWLLSPTKVHRYDGKNILSFSFDDRCIGIQQDDEGTVWIASRQNIYRFKNEYAGFEKLSEYSSPVTKYLSLLAGPAKKLYLLTTEGIIRWNRASNKMEQAGIAPFKSKRNFADLKFSGDWLFYRLNDNTVMRYNTVTGAQDSIHVPEPNFFVPLDADNVWMRQGIGSTVLVSFKTKTVSPVNKAQFDEAFTDNRLFITGSFAGLPGEFFTILDNKGYYRYNTTNNRFTKINLFYNGLPLTGKPVLTTNNFFKEANGTAWFTNEEGMFFFNAYAGSIGLLRSNNNGGSGQWNNDVRNFAEDNNGNIWFSTANGFCSWDKSTGSVAFWTPKFDADNYLNYSSVKAMGFSNNKFIIGQSEKGFWIFDPAKQTFSRPQFEADSLKKRFEKGFNANMLQLRNGNFLALSGEVWLIDKETFYVKLVKIPEVAIGPRKAYEDAQGRIWLLGTNGISAVDEKFNLLYSLSDKVRGKWYNAIVQTDENTFWVAAKNLYEIKLQPQKQLAIRPIFPEFKTQHFSNLFKDSSGHIWMCNDEGMYRYVPEKDITEKFDQTDNVQGFYAGVSNSFRGNDGTVYFGSLNGINYFVPEKISLQNDSLQVQLLNVTVNKDDSTFLLHGALQSLSHTQNTLAFDFISPYLYNGEKIQYRYKLEGSDKDWITLGNSTSVHFNSLQPGSYTFHVAASLNGKDWFPMQSPFTFKIKPPFWKTWWFRILSVLLIGYFVFYFSRDRIHKIKQRENFKRDYERKIAEVEMQALRAQMNPHFMFNSLNSINNFILKNDPDNASGYLTKFSRLMRLILDNSRSEWVLLENELKALELYIQLEAVRFDNSFDYNIETAKDISIETVVVPPLIIQPYVENAIWHGLLHRKEPGGKLDIHLWKNNGTLHIEIEDNGVGRDEAMRQKSKTATKQKSHGMKITAERMNIVNKVYNVDAGVAITDLKNETGGNGTRVLITLKYKTNDSHNSG